MKKPSFLEMVKLGFILSAFAATACIILAFVYSGTAPVIKQRQFEAMKASIQDLFPEADSFEEITGIYSPDSTVTIINSYAALRDGEIIGLAVQASRFSFEGQIVILVGVDTEERISGVRILENPDTPGFGANASSSNFFVDRVNRITFYGQFAGKSTRDPFEVRRDVAVITASTITSRAIASSVRAAGLAANAWFVQQTEFRRD